MSENIYSRLGAVPIINAAGNSTAMGGSTPTPIVKQAMEDAEQHFVDMEELLEKSGDHIASLLGAEAAYVHGWLLRCDGAVYRCVYNRQRPRKNGSAPRHHRHER